MADPDPSSAALGLARAVLAADPLGARGAGGGDGIEGADGEGADGGSPGPLRRAAARAIADVIASSFAVHADAAALADRDRLLAWARSEGAAVDPRPVIGTGTGLAPSRAALIGGFQAHLLDLDDTHELVRGHPSAVLVPAMLALAEQATRIEDMLRAYTVGVEVMARLSLALGPAHYGAGWHPTGTAGTVAAAAAGAALLRLDVEETATALSIAASRSGGVRAQFGTPGKPLHAGLAAQHATEAVAWARTGLRTAGEAVLGANGLLAGHGVDEHARDQLIRQLSDGLGPPWVLTSPGLWFKRHPFCSAAMSASDAAEQLAAQLGAAEEAEDVVVRMRPGADAALVHTRPATGEQARFSVEAVVAMILQGIEPDLAQLSAAPIDPRVDALVARMRREHVPQPAGAPGAAPGSARRSFWAQVEVRTSAGRTLRTEVEHPLGSPQNPLPDSALQAKLAGAVGEPERAARIRGVLADPAAPVSALATLLMGPPSSPQAGAAALPGRGAEAAGR